MNYENNNGVPFVDKVSIWRKKSQYGTDYLSGMVIINGCEYKFVAFANRYKSENEKKPDYISIARKQN